MCDDEKRLTCGKKYLENISSELTLVPSINQFKFQTSSVQEYTYDPVNKSIVGAVTSINTPYNGRVNIPLSPNNKLIANVTFGTTKVQFIVFDANNMSESQFGNKHQNSNRAVDQLFVDVNSQRLPIGNITNLYNVNAYYCLIRYYCFLYSVLGRVGLTDAPHVLVGICNVKFTNAYWNGYCMVFGNGRDGSVRGCTPLTSMDVCGHELSHGLQTFTTEFVYQGESGAINESVADQFGCALEFWENSPVDRPDWLIGEQFRFTIRNMANPENKRQPAYYKQKGFWYSGPQDNGGVHINSGVTNYLFFLASTGLRNFTTRIGTRIADTPVPAGYNMSVYIKSLYNLLRSRRLNVRCNMRRYSAELINQHLTGFKSDITTIVGCVGLAGTTGVRITEEGFETEDCCDCEETPVPYEETPVPYEETPVPYEETPVPYEETPVPYEETPVPYEETPVPSTDEDVPVPYEETPTSPADEDVPVPPFDDSTPPVEETPTVPPVEETPTVPPVEETPTVPPVPPNSPNEETPEHSNCVHSEICVSHDTPYRYVQKFNLQNLHGDVELVIVFKSLPFKFASGRSPCVLTYTQQDLEPIHLILDKPSNDGFICKVFNVNLFNSCHESAALSISFLNSHPDDCKAIMQIKNTVNTENNHYKLMVKSTN